MCSCNVSFVSAIIKLRKHLMPQQFESTLPKWDKKVDECQLYPLNFSWTLISKGEILTVLVTCLKWTYNYEFWIQITAHPQRDPNIPKQKISTSITPMLKFLSDAFYKNKQFPEPHLNSHQLRFMGKLIDYFDFFDL